MINLKRQQLGKGLFEKLQTQIPEIQFVEFTESVDNPNDIWVNITVPEDEDRQILVYELAGEISTDILMDHGELITIIPTDIKIDFLYLCDEFKHILGNILSETNADDLPHMWARYKSLAPDKAKWDETIQQIIYLNNSLAHSQPIPEGELVEAYHKLKKFIETINYELQ
jgi:hypothetical protein